MRITSRRNGNTVAGVELRQQHSEHENRNESNRDEKYADRLEMFVRNMRDYDVLTWMRRWAACITSNVGITSCRGEEKLYTSIKVGHSRTSGLFNIRFGDYTVIVTTTLRDDI
jgi:hypothetical protein